MKALFTLLCCAVILLSSCNSYRENVTYGKIELPATDLLSYRDWDIRSDYAFPVADKATKLKTEVGYIPSGSTEDRIYIRQQKNYFKIKGDSIWVNLPYYGYSEKENDTVTNGDFLENPTIDFVGIPDHLEMRKPKKNQVVNLKVDFTKDEDKYRALIMVYKDRHTRIILMGRNLTAIQYRGALEKQPTIQRDSYVTF